MPTFHSYLYDSGQHGPGPYPLPSPELLSGIGAITAVVVSVPPVVEVALSAAGGGAGPAPETGASLIDTGASLTCVHEPLLQTLGLHPTGTIESGTAAGRVQQSLYYARVTFPQLRWTSDLVVAGVDLGGQVASTNPPQPIVALLGRNLLRNWTLVWHGAGGHWSVST